MSDFGSSDVSVRLPFRWGAGSEPERGSDDAVPRVYKSDSGVEGYLPSAALQMPYVLYYRVNPDCSDGHRDPQASVTRVIPTNAEETSETAHERSQESPQKEQLISGRFLSQRQSAGDDVPGVLRSLACQR